MTTGRRLRKFLPVAALPLLIGLSRQAPAAVLYTNGPANGYINGWDIQSFLQIDSFPLSAPAAITGIEFASWTVPGGEEGSTNGTQTNPGDTITSIDWAITTEPTLTPEGPDYGTPYASGTASVTASFLFQNSKGEDVDTDNFSIPSLALAAGTYYLRLQHAVTAEGKTAYWDENDGPSHAWLDDNGVGMSTCCSHAFEVLGTSTEPDSVPEPASLALLGTALAGIGLVIARRRKPF